MRFPALGRPEAVRQVIERAAAGAGHSRFGRRRKDVVRWFDRQDVAVVCFGVVVLRYGRRILFVFIIRLLARFFGRHGLLLSAAAYCCLSRLGRFFSTGSRNQPHSMDLTPSPISTTGNPSLCQCSGLVIRPRLNPAPNAGAPSIRPAKRVGIPNRTGTEE